MLLKYCERTKFQKNGPITKLVRPIWWLTSDVTDLTNISPKIRWFPRKTSWQTCEGSCNENSTASFIAGNVHHGSQLVAESPRISNNHLLKDPLSNWDIQGFRSLHAILSQHVVSVQYKVGKGHFALRKWKNLPKRLAGARCPLVSLRRFFQFEKFQVFNFDFGRQYALNVNIALMRSILQMPLV